MFTLGIISKKRAASRFQTDCKQALSYDRQTDVTIGQCVMPDRNLACAILIRYKALSDGEVRVCLLL